MLFLHQHNIFPQNQQVFAEHKRKVLLGKNNIKCTVFRRVRQNFSIAGKRMQFLYMVDKRIMFHYILGFLEGNVFWVCKSFSYIFDLVKKAEKSMFQRFLLERGLLLRKW